MSIKEVLESLIPDEPYSNIGFISRNFQKEIVDVANSKTSSAIEMKVSNRLPFLAEHFEAIVIEDDEVLEKVAKDVSRVIQKNRNLIVISKFSKEKIEELFQGFTNFSSFQVENMKVTICKKWFQIAN
jgi:hypothetical protein